MARFVDRLAAIRGKLLGPHGRVQNGLILLHDRPRRKYTAATSTALGEDIHRCRWRGPESGGFDPAWGKAWAPVHPRSYGTYPRILGKYVREEKILTLEEAIRKMSSAVAQRLHVQDRGLLREGMCADVVIFDPDTIGDRATYDDPHQISEGIRDVWVNGSRVLAKGSHTGATPGEIVTPN